MEQFERFINVCDLFFKYWSPTSQTFETIAIKQFMQDYSTHLRDAWFLTGVPNFRERERKKREQKNVATQL